MKKLFKKKYKCCSSHGGCPMCYMKLFVGIGIGLLLTHPVADPNPVRWALGFFGAAIVIHLWARNN